MYRTIPSIIIYHYITLYININTNCHLYTCYSSLDDTDEESAGWDECAYPHATRFTLFGVSCFLPTCWKYDKAILRQDESGVKPTLCSYEELEALPPCEKCFSLSDKYFPYNETIYKYARTISLRCHLHHDIPAGKCFEDFVFPCGCSTRSDEQYQYIQLFHSPIKCAYVTHDDWKYSFKAPAYVDYYRNAKCKKKRRCGLSLTDRKRYRLGDRRQSRMENNKKAKVTE